MFAIIIVIFLVAIFLFSMALMLYEISNAIEVTDMNKCEFCEYRWEHFCPLNGGNKCPYFNNNSEIVGGVEE